MISRTGIPVLGCVVLSALALSAPLAAQSKAPSGTYGFVGYANQMDTAGWTGGAYLGVMKIGEDGSVTGTLTFQGRDTVDPASQLGTAAFTGTYSSGADGIGTLRLVFDDDDEFSFAVVTADGGQTFHFNSPAFGAANIVLTGSNLSLTGALPASLIRENFNGTISLKVDRPDSRGATVFTGRAAASGDVTCGDGSSGKWTINVESLTVAAIGAGNNGQALAGDYLLTANSEACGDRGWHTLSGLVTGNFTPTGLRLVLRSYGYLHSGTARAIKGAALKGSYVLQPNFSPFPAGAVAIFTFDGEGAVSATFVSSGNGEFTTTKVTGKYSVNEDGSGEINFNTPVGDSGGATFSIAVVDDGAAFLFLRTRANPQGGNVQFGVARAQ